MIAIQRFHKPSFTLPLFAITFTFLFSTAFLARSANLANMAYLSKVITHSYADYTEIFFQLSKNPDSTKISLWKEGFIIEILNAFINKNTPKTKQINDGIVKNLNIYQYQPNTVRIKVYTQIKISKNYIKIINTKSPYGILVKIKAYLGTQSLQGKDVLSSQQKTINTFENLESIRKENASYNSSKPQYYNETGTMLRMISALAIVLGIILIAYHLLKRFNHPTGKIRNIKDIIKIIAKTEIFFIICLIIIHPLSNTFKLLQSKIRIYYFSNNLK